MPCFSCTFGNAILKNLSKSSRITICRSEAVLTFAASIFKGPEILVDFLHALPVERLAYLGHCQVKRVLLGKICGEQRIQCWTDDNVLSQHFQDSFVR